MGYYTTYEVDVTIRPAFIEKVRQKLKEAAKNKQYYQWDDVEITHDGYVELSDYYRKSYSDDVVELAEIIAPFAEPGDIIGRGEEDGDLWKVEFDGNGGYNFKIGTIIYGSLFDSFMDHYNKAMPKKLKTELEKWRTIEKI